MDTPTGGALDGTSTAHVVLLAQVVGNRNGEGCVVARRIDQERMAAIRPVKESVEDELLGRPGVVGVDIGEKVSQGRGTGELGILVFVQHKKPADQLSAEELVPRDVEGIRTDVQEMVIELQSVRELLRPGRQVDASTYETLSGGISMGPSRTVRLEPPEVPEPGEYTFVGTLGAIVRDRGAGRIMALTNFHVACVNDEWSSGDRMVHPGRPDGGEPGTDEFGALARAQLTENTDGAVVLIDEGREWEAAVVGIGPVVGIAEAAPDLPVQKRGRTTGHTFGTVVSTEATLSLDYGDGLGSRTFRRQLRITTDASRSARFSDGGDSGSAVLDTEGHVVGLLFAGDTEGGTTFANPIQVALDELDVDLETAEPAQPTQPESPAAPETGGCTTSIYIETVNITVNH